MNTYLDMDKLKKDQGQAFSESGLREVISETFRKAGNNKEACSALLRAKLERNHDKIIQAEAKLAQSNGCTLL